MLKGSSSAADLMAHLASPYSAALPRYRPLTASDPRRSSAIGLLLLLWLAVFFGSLFTPPLLDDADASHASAARAIVSTGNWVTLKIDGVRYLEKAPLPYWLVAASFRVFGFNTFATHLPQALAVLLLALLAYAWGDRAFDRRTAFYAGLGVLTSAGVFLFTRWFIPEALLSLLLFAALFLFLFCLEPSQQDRSRTRVAAAYGMWASLALAVLTKGLIALVFFFGTVVAYGLLTGELRRWRALRPGTGVLLFLAITAPWHILAGLRNTGGMNGHGFFWFYFVNEHVLRFLGRRYPKDYNKLPWYLYWSLHEVWLFPWSLFVPTGVLLAYRRLRPPHGPLLRRLRELSTVRGRTTLLLTLFACLILIFFSLSTNQEYYTFPAYAPLLLLIANAITRSESNFSSDVYARRWITFAHATLTVLGAAAALALAAGLWQSRHLPYVPDIGDLLAHRGVGDYTLSMSHFFDLTGPSFAGLRLPALLAAVTFAVGPAIAWLSRQQRRHLAATTAIAFFSAAFLVTAHIALARFGPMLSSECFAAQIQDLERSHAVAALDEVLLFGDQSYGSSIPFYLGRQVLLVDGRSSSMLFGSTFADAPPVFLTTADLLSQWGKGRTKLLFVPLERRDAFDRLGLGDRAILLQETSGKSLFTDRPLLRPSENMSSFSLHTRTSATPRSQRGIPSN